MNLRRTSRLALAVIAAGLVVPALTATSAVADPTPLGLTCAPIEDGVRHCPGDGEDLRVPSFDGVPIDVDVTLPLTGDGPWPTIVLINGLGGDKAQLQRNVESPPSDTPPPLPPNTTHYDNVWFAENDYAVVNIATRGFGGSCAFGPFGVGTQGGAKLQTGDCAEGYMRGADARYTARDAQHLLGLLVDQGISQPTKNGATGFSYGGGLSAILGALNDRVMCDGIDRGDLCDGADDGELVPWTSPAGTPMAMGAIYGQWLWTDLSGSFIVNGRFLDFDDSTIDLSLEPLGVFLQSYGNALLLLAESRGYVPTVGVGNPEWDFEQFVAALNAGEPYDPVVDDVAQLWLGRHSALGIKGDPAPMLLQNGWTDDVFPVREGLKLYNDLHRRFDDPDVVLLFSDYGHSRSANRDLGAEAFNDIATAFFDSRLKGEGDGPAPGSVIVYESTCPATGDGAALERGPFVAASWDAISSASVTFANDAAQNVAWLGGDLMAGLNFDPIPQTNPLFGTFDPCKTVPPPNWPPNTVATAEMSVDESFTMTGLPTIRAAIASTGPFGQLNGRLFEVDGDGNHRLITRGTYRLEPNQSGEIAFQLQGNAYTFTAGNTILLELAPSDAPNFRLPDRPFVVAVDGLSVELPLLDDAARAGGGDESGGSGAPIPTTGGGAVVAALTLVFAAVARRWTSA